MAELFEARRPKDHAIIAEIVRHGRVRQGLQEQAADRRSQPDEEGDEPVEYLIPRGKHSPCRTGTSSSAATISIDGHPAPHDILAIKGVEELADFLINEIQDVYRLQGVTINDKHIEVIVRQMLQKVEITDAGDTGLHQGRAARPLEFDEVNAKAEKAGPRPATAVPVLLGITKASLQTRSFISAASFQETTRVLTEAAVNGKIDTLEGLKENVIVGRLIPAGTGGMLRGPQDRGQARRADRQGAGQGEAALAQARAMTVEPRRRAGDRRGR